TARPSASSRRCFASGPTGASTAARRSEPASSLAGFTATTSIESTAPSAIARRQLDSTSYSGTTCLGTTVSCRSARRRGEPRWLPPPGALAWPDVEAPYTGPREPEPLLRHLGHAEFRPGQR